MKKQCKLEKDNKTMVIWVPVKHAVMNKNLTVDGDPGWIVKEVGDVTLDNDQFKLMSSQYLSTRKVSDI